MTITDNPLLGSLGLTYLQAADAITITNNPTGTLVFPVHVYGRGEGCTLRRRGGRTNLSVGGS